MQENRTHKPDVWCARASFIIQILCFTSLEKNASFHAAIFKAVSEVVIAWGMPSIIYITFYNLVFKDLRWHK